jgi:hypothetical protein
MWSLISKKKVFTSKWREMEEWVMKNPKKEKHFFYIDSGKRKDIVFIFGITADKKVLILRQYFYAHLKKINCVVAGFVEKNNPRQTAINELRQEAGCIAEKFIFLGSFLRGKYTQGREYYFLAKNVEQKFEQKLESAEDIQPKFVDFNDFVSMLKNGRIHGGQEALCSYLALDYLNKHR